MPFVSYDTLLSLLLESNLPIGLDDYSLLSFLLIRTKAGVDVEPLRARLTAALPDADFYTPACVSSVSTRSWVRRRTSSPPR
jgi:hypothetical protein